MMGDTVEIPIPVKPSLPPTTTVEEDLHSSSQRRINVIWETTQATIAISVVLANVIAAFFSPASETSSTTLTNAMFVVIGFYFGRTNHQKVGGVQLGR